MMFISIRLNRRQRSITRVSIAVFYCNKLNQMLLSALYFTKTFTKILIDPNIRIPQPAFRLTRRTFNKKNRSVPRYRNSEPRAVGCRIIFSQNDLRVLDHNRSASWQQHPISSRQITQKSPDLISVRSHFVRQLYIIEFFGPRYFPPEWKGVKGNGDLFTFIMLCRIRYLLRIPFAYSRYDDICVIASV